ncbi:MAG TPA: glycoside hydrolase family 43 protein [Steroidobacteraceae bacterium]|nr:glycoside hydrolase family 43 protein [Steroidobacteraceae bacterium]
MNRNLPRAPRLAFSLALVPLLGGVSPPAAPAGVEPVSFDWFEYTGRDTVFATPLPPGSYRNPILAGFYPDPSITRVGNKFYLVSSTFAYFPSLPVFESADLVHWKQIGNAIGPPAQLDFDGLDISRGVFAPDIEFHDGTFYVLNTAVDSGGNYFVTARNPAGPWSAPVWLPELDGIDPSLFFDTDGKAYILNNGPPAGKPLYPGHRAIWIQEVRLPAGKLFGERKVLVNGGVDISTKPVWIEGPHLYRRQEWYYLMCAEGGTGPGHSEVVLRSHSPWGPFMPYAGNPILTQRDLADDRANPVANAGHADLVEAPDGSWWATFLASRTYERTHYNTGRETFLLPVTWRDGWPLILARGQSVPYVVHGPGFMTRGTQAPFSGNFTWRDDFDSDVLKHEWLNARVPKKPWADLRSRPGTLTIHPLPASLDTLENPSFLARRQQHTAFDASTAFELPQAARVSAGIAVFQNEKFWYWLGSHRTDHGAEVFLQRQNGPTPETVATAPLAASGPLKLRISADARAYSFLYDPDGKGWRALRQNEDGSLLSTDIAGGFVGAMVGPFARAE